MTDVYCPFCKYYIGTYDLPKGEYNISFFCPHCRKYITMRIKVKVPNVIKL